MRAHIPQLAVVFFLATLADGALNAETLLVCDATTLFSYVTEKSTSLTHQITMRIYDDFVETSEGEISEISQKSATSIAWTGRSGDFFTLFNLDIISGRLIMFIGKTPPFSDESELIAQREYECRRVDSTLLE